MVYCTCVENQFSSHGLKKPDWALCTWPNQSRTVLPHCRDLVPVRPPSCGPSDLPILSRNVSGVKWPVSLAGMSLLGTAPLPAPGHPAGAAAAPCHCRLLGWQMESHKLCHWVLPEPVTVVCAVRVLVQSKFNLCGFVVFVWCCKKEKGNDSLPWLKTAPFKVV